jgi:UPF0716 protein FxsA
MRPLLLLIVLLSFPALEIYLLFRAAEIVGLWVLAWLALAFVAGWALIAQERIAFLPRLMESAVSGSPLSALLDTSRFMLAGFLLMFPGFISDLIALVLLLLPGGHPPGSSPGRGRREGPAGDIIEGEARRVDPEGGTRRIDIE